MSFNHSLISYLIMIYLITGLLVIGTSHIVSVGLEYSSGQQKIIRVSVIFEPICIVLDKLI